MTEQIPHIRDLQRIALFRGNRNIPSMQLCTANLHIDSRITHKQAQKKNRRDVIYLLFVLGRRICINGTTR